MTAKKKLEINPPKINGFSKPLHRLQVTSWIVYTYLNISFHLIYGCHYDNNGIFIVFNIIHFILSIMMFISAYSATNKNVVDQFIEERGFPKATMSMIEFRNKYYAPLQNKEFAWCQYCNWYVTKSSKHCRACNRCTNNFDHHCRWLNNCISKENYIPFFIAICCTETLLLYEIILGILMLSNQINITNHLFIQSSNKTVLYSFITLQIFIACFMAIPIAQLIVFHIYLYNKQISTYEWVVKREKKKEEKKRNKNKNNKKNKDKNNKTTEKTSASSSDSLNKQRNNSMNKYIKQEESLTTTDSTENENENENKKDNQKMKAKMVAISTKNIKKGLRKYIYSLRDCESKFNRKNVTEQNKAPDLVSSSQSNRGLAVDTNVDVKLSGLSTNGSTDDTPPMHRIQELNDINPPRMGKLFCQSICKCNNNNLKKRNSVHVINMFKPPIHERVQKYSHDDKDDHVDDEHDGIIFGPGHILSGKQSVINTNVSNTNCTKQENKKQNISIQEVECEENTDEIVNES